MTKLEEFKATIAAHTSGVAFIAVLAALPMGVLAISEPPAPTEESLYQHSPSNVMRETATFLKSVSRYAIYREIFADPSLSPAARYDAIRTELASDFPSLSWKLGKDDAAQLQDHIDLSLEIIDDLNRELAERLDDNSSAIDSGPKLRKTLRELADRRHTTLDGDVRLAAMK